MKCRKTFKEAYEKSLDATKFEICFNIVLFMKFISNFVECEHFFKGPSEAFERISTFELSTFCLKSGKTLF